MLEKFRFAVVAALMAASMSVYAETPATLHDSMRSLWMDHVVWTRLFIISAAAELPDQAVTTQRLLQNQVNIGNAIASYYGRAAGDQLTALLTDHILIAAKIVKAAKGGDTATVTSESARWKQNANDIAAFLHAANPRYWPLDAMQSAMQMHLEQTLAEATHRLNGDYAADVHDYEHVVEHILSMSDILSSGIVSQFPSQFQGARSR